MVKVALVFKKGGVIVIMVYWMVYRSESSHSNTAVGSNERLSRLEIKREVNSKSHVEQHGWWLEFKILPDWIGTMEQSMGRTRLMGWPEERRSASYALWNSGDLGSMCSYRSLESGMNRGPKLNEGFRQVNKVKFCFYVDSICSRRRVIKLTNNIKRAE